MPLEFLQYRLRSAELQANLALLSLARYFGALFAAYTFVILTLFEGHPHMGLLAAPQLDARLSGRSFSLTFSHSPKDNKVKSSQLCSISLIYNDIRLTFHILLVGNIANISDRKVKQFISDNDVRRQEIDKRSCSYAALSSQPASRRRQVCELRRS